MPWPLSQDYNEAIQNPAQCFGDPELKQGEAVTNALGLPQTCSGNFADVYAVQTGTRKWAVKCFTRQITGLQERYNHISLYLQQVNLPFMVDFKFLQNGIRVRGDWYPVLKMEWVEGFTLNAFIRDNLDKPNLLQTLGELWVKLAVRLREANLAHCDLQHGNVLLVPGKREGSLAVKLIDYDGMLVPALAGKRSSEVGHACYQHPQRLRDGTYTLDVDRFPHLVICTALQALRHGGRALWERHDNGDNLLFRQTDLAAPRTSALFQELSKADAPHVRQLAQTLAIASQKPLDQTPLLEQVAGLPVSKPATIARRTRSERRTVTARRRKRAWLLIPAACLLLVAGGLGFWWHTSQDDLRAQRAPTPQSSTVAPTPDTGVPSPPTSGPRPTFAANPLDKRLYDWHTALEQHKSSSATLKHITVDLKPVQQAETEQARLDRLRTELQADAGAAGKADQLEEAAKDLQTTRQEIVQARKRVELIQSLQRTMEKADLDAYARQAAAYAKAFPAEDRGKALALVAKELPLWQTTLEWNKVVRGLGKDPLAVRVKESKATGGPLEICRAYQARHPQAASAAVVTSYMEFLEAIGQRDESDAKSAVSDLRAVLDLVYVKGTYYIEVDGGKKYYAKEDFSPLVRKAVKNTDPIRAEVLVNLEGKAEMRTIRYKRVQKYGQAPQGRAAEEAQAELKKLLGKAGGADWDDVLIKIGRLIQDEAEMDPFLKHLLLQRILTAAARGSTPLRAALTRSLESLKEAKVDPKVNWIDPDDKTANEARAAAAKAIAALPELREAAKACSAAKQQLTATLLKSERVPCGWMLKTQQTGWGCESAGKPPKGELLVLVPSGDSSAWQPVGHVGLDGPTLQTGNKALQEGRLLFLLKAAP